MNLNHDRIPEETFGSSHGRHVTVLPVASHGVVLGQPVVPTPSLLENAVKGLTRPISRFTAAPNPRPSGSANYSNAFEPYLLLTPRAGATVPEQWVLMRLKLTRTDGVDAPVGLRLCFDHGDGFFKTDRSAVLMLASGVVEALMLVPHAVQGLGIDRHTLDETFVVDDFSVQAISKTEAAARILLPHAPSVMARPWFHARRLRALRQGGSLRLALKGLYNDRFVQEPVTARNSYRRWIETFTSISSVDRQKIARHIAALARAPLFSIVMPVYNPPEKWLRVAIESVLHQLYQRWELCIADDASTNPAIREVLLEYAQRDPRIKVTFRSENGHISAASNSAIELASGDFIVLLDQDDELTEHALYLCAAELDSHPRALLLYSDEDKIDEEGERFDPYFKSSWNPDLFLSQNMISHLGVYETARLKAIGGFRVGFEGSQDYDMALRFIEGIEADQIRHIPHVLYHWRSLPGSTALATGEKTYALTSMTLATQEYLARQSIDARVLRVDNTGFQRVQFLLPAEVPLVSIIIPTRNGLSILKGCIDSVRQKTTYANYEVIVVDNQSDDPDTLAYLNDIQAAHGLRVVAYDRPFNYSSINNTAVELANGEFICLLNNDIEVISADWLSEMVSHALRPGIGAVGAKLYYANGTIQHAGVIAVGGVASHAFKHSPRDHMGYFGRAVLTQNYSAVTGACLLVRKSLYLEVGGLNEQDLAVAFNDIDFCWKLQRAGYRNVWTPFAELYHHESISRGADETPEQQARFQREIDYMQEHWLHEIEHDPGYNPNLTTSHEDFSLAWPSRARRPWL